MGVRSQRNHARGGETAAVPVGTRAVPDAPEDDGFSSTHRSSTGGTSGVDTIRLLYAVDRVPPVGILDLDQGFKLQSFPHLHLVAAEGNPDEGLLWAPQELVDVAVQVRDLVDATFGVREDRGLSRVDLTTSRRFRPADGRAFLTGMAAMEFPRLEGRRRPNVGQARSIDWTGARSAAIRARVYCESFKVAGRKLGEQVRVEAQQRAAAGARVPLDVAADPAWQRQTFLRRFEPMRKAVDGVTVMTLPILERAVIEDVKSGLRSTREAERLLGASVFLRHGEGAAYPKATLSRRRRELREAGYVVVDDVAEPVTVHLGDELEAALAEFAA
ncbi:MAG TPA: hypothetical protein VH392_12485 [Sphingomicrobium sp.]